MARARSGLVSNITDGIIQWFDGPEWDDVAEEHFRLAAEQIEEMAKQDAVWEDRSGAAREGLTAEAFNRAGEVGVVLYHTVEYGIWLELIQNGRFAIIMPTLEQEGKRVTYNAIRRIRTARRGSS